jgi:hypothetical protein
VEHAIETDAADLLHLSWKTELSYSDRTDWQRSHARFLADGQTTFSSNRPIGAVTSGLRGKRSAKGSAYGRNTVCLAVSVVHRTEFNPPSLFDKSAFRLVGLETYDRIAVDLHSLVRRLLPLAVHLSYV